MLRVPSSDELELIKEYLELSDASPTGLVWKKKPSAKVYVGEPAMLCIDSGGYYRGMFKKKGYAAHRIVFYLYHNRWPTGEIDHINGDRLDNSPPNLREVDRSFNSANRGRGYQVLDNGTFLAQIRRQGKTYKKTFNTEEQAIRWRKEMRLFLYGTDIWQQ
ncbi:hypothetical protein W70_248 [Escherichia phage W70]|nr:hypothetical protein W70_248 [Escherichia phage W70]